MFKSLTIVCVMVLGLLGGCDRTESDWKQAKDSNTVPAYTDFIAKHPQAVHVEEARVTIEDFDWNAANSGNNVDALNAYLSKYPKGRFASKAAGKIEDLNWASVTASNTIAAYSSFLANYPGSARINEAKKQIEALAWKQANDSNTVPVYTDFIATHPQAAHVDEARTAIEDLDWKQAKQSDSIADYNDFLSNHPQGAHAVEAKAAILQCRAREEDRAWQQAKGANTIRALQEYLQAYPKGRFFPDAKSRQIVLSSDDRPFSAAMHDGTEDALRQFLRDFPGHIKVAEVQKALSEITVGRDIVDLLDDKTIEVQTQGSDIQSVSVKIRKLVPRVITVLIPVGTFFDSGNGSAQSMVTTKELEVTLNDDQWQSVSPSVACANRPKSIPGSSDSFSVLRSPQQSELARLMPVLEKAGVDYATRQAAVWIITDNANYDDLGELIESVNGMDGSRVIHEAEAARAMQICDQAGIDITQRAIWNDREQIARGLSEGGLKAWLVGKR